MVSTVGVAKVLVRRGLKAGRPEKGWDLGQRTWGPRLPAAGPRS